MLAIYTLGAKFGQLNPMPIIYMSMIAAIGQRAYLSLSKTLISYIITYVWIIHSSKLYLYFKDLHYGFSVFIITVYVPNV